LFAKADVNALVVIVVPFIETTVPIAVVPFDAKIDCPVAMFVAVLTTIEVAPTLVAPETCVAFTNVLKGVAVAALKV